MRNIKLILEYDGTSFAGFQAQKERRTVQGELEKALSRLLNSPAKIKAASGRTDAGVHARSQVVNFYTDQPLRVFQIQNGLNRYLPPQIAVTSAAEVSRAFHARFDARRKVYEYRVWNSPARSPLEAGRSHHVYEKLNIRKMKEAATYLIGRHDFSAFCACGTQDKERRKNSVRTIYHFKVKGRQELILFLVEGDGFLHHMVRNMVGTLLAVGRGRLRPSDIKVILKSKDRRKAAETAPALGLTLLNVTY